MTKALVLRTCAVDMKSHGGFEWPTTGRVECPDWAPTKACGAGLHGWLWGEGASENVSADYSPDAKWLVVEVDAEDVVDLGGKVKFHRGEVVFCGDRLGATSFLLERAPGRVVIGACVTAGDRGHAHVGGRGQATADFRGRATAGDYGTATAGRYGTATAGFRGTATAGIGSTATAGNSGTATAGNEGTATAGDYGTATAGRYGTATAGEFGTATAGIGGTATAGRYGTATAGYRGTATAGVDGILNIRWWDGDRYRIATAYVGEGGIEANVKYKLDGKGAFVKAEDDK